MLRGDVGPVAAAVAGDLQQSVVRASPDDALLAGRLRDREHDAGVLHADVVRRQSARALLPAPIVERQVGADHLPGLTAVGRAVHVLRSGVDGVVIVRRNRHRKRPVESVLHVAGRRADGRLRPDFDLARLPRPLVVALDGPADAAEPGAARPDDVVVRRIGNRPPALAAGDRMPHAAWNRSGDLLVGLFGEPAVARAARRRSVLPIAVDVVWNLVVGGHVIHLRDRQLNLMPALSAVDRQAEAVVVGDDEAIAVGGIDPHVVVVADGREAAGEIDARLAAVQRLGELGRQEVRLVFVVGLDGEARVVVRASSQAPIGADELPVLAAVVAAPERPALRRRAVGPRQAVAGLDQRVDAAGIAARDLRRDLSDGRLRQPVTVEPFPGESAVDRLVQAAAGAAADPSPGVNLELPHPRKEDARIAGVDGDVRAAGVLVDEQGALPGLAAVGGAVHAALLLRTVGVAERAREHDLGIARVDQHAADAAGQIEPAVFPRAAGIG